MKKVSNQSTLSSSKESVSWVGLVYSGEPLKGIKPFLKEKVQSGRAYGEAMWQEPKHDL